MHSTFTMVEALIRLAPSVPLLAQPVRRRQSGAQGDQLIGAVKQPLGRGEVSGAEPLLVVRAADKDSASLKRRRAVLVIQTPDASVFSSHHGTSPVAGQHVCASAALMGPIDASCRAGTRKASLAATSLIPGGS